MRFDVVVHEQSLICRGIFFGKRGSPVASGRWTESFQTASYK
jgi:hypothetical protein